MRDVIDQHAPTETHGELQHTLAHSVEVCGQGLMSSEEVRLVMHPAPVGHGIMYERADLDPSVQVPALERYVRKRTRRTAIAIGDIYIDTIEHCQSALAGLRVDNVLLELHGAELPCGDGSAGLFVDAINGAGLVAQDAPRTVHRITEPIMVQEGDAMLAAFPTEEDTFQAFYDLDYGVHSHRIQRQAFNFTTLNGNYHTELAPARTFSLKEEAEALWEKGLCRHLTPREVLVIGEDGPIDNAYKFDNEPVRHKILDLMGDLYLTGCQVYGRFVAYKSGHDLNHRLAKLIIEQIESEQRLARVRHDRVLDIRNIQKIMPHRYPMLLVDRVVSMEDNKRAVGVKNVSINEPFFGGHYPGTPIMPGVLIVEAMAQLGGLLMSQKLDYAGKIAVLLSIDKVKFRKPVVPGDQLILEVETITARSRMASMRCRALVGSKLAAEALIRFMMVDPDPE